MEAPAGENITFRRFAAVWMCAVWQSLNLASVLPDCEPYRRRQRRGATVVEYELAPSNRFGDFAYSAKPFRILNILGSWAKSNCIIDIVRLIPVPLILNDIQASVVVLLIFDRLSK